MLESKGRLSYQSCVVLGVHVLGGGGPRLRHGTHRTARVLERLLLEGLNLLHFAVAVQQLQVLVEDLADIAAVQVNGEWRT